MIRLILRLLAVLAILALPPTALHAADQPVTGGLQARNVVTHGGIATGCFVITSLCVPCATCAAMWQFGGSAVRIAKKAGVEPLPMMILAGTKCIPMLRPP